MIPTAQDPVDHTTLKELERLVRITSISMTCRDVEFKQSRPTLRAAIGLDVVYEDVDREGD